MRTFFQLYRFGVGVELWTLVDVHDPYRDGRCRPARLVDASGQRNLVFCLDGQHEGTVLLKIYGLDRRQDGRLSDVIYFNFYIIK